MSARLRGAPRRASALWLVLGAFVALLGVARPCAAEYRHRVVLFEPPSESDNAEIHARLRGELVAAGFDVVVRPAPPGAQLKAAAETVAGELHPAAVIYVVEPAAGAEEGTPVQVWISDRLLRRTFVLSFHEAPDTPGNEAAKAAVQAVEILKADLAELSVTRAERPEPPPPAPPPLPPPAPPAREPVPARLELHAGVALLQGFSGLGSTWTPFFRAGVSLPERWLGGAPLTLSVLGSLTAFGGEARLEAPAGDARVRQALGGLTLVGRLAPRSVVQPFFSLSGGVYSVDVRGTRGARVRSEQTYSAASGAGLGLWFELSPAFALVLSGDATLAWARTVVRIAAQPVATAGAPLATGGASVVGVF